MTAILTARAALELAGHEALVREWYIDSGGVGTWGIGVTNASGHMVDRYKDNPQTIQRCLEVFVWLVHTRYMGDVEEAFSGHELSEAELAAALSFHYNTGAIKRTDWPRMVLDGDRDGARHFLETHYLNNGLLAKRRHAEASLFFDGVWSGNGRVLVYPVQKPGYQPDFAHAQSVDMTADMAAAMTP